jgi:hypothetical protein
MRLSDTVVRDLMEMIKRAGVSPFHPFVDAALACFELTVR